MTHARTSMMIPPLALPLAEDGFVSTINNIAQTHSQTYLVGVGVGVSSDLALNGSGRLL